MSHRSSTSMSLLHGEVINLEGDAAIRQYRRRQMQQQQQPQHRLISVQDYDGGDELAPLSPNPMDRPTAHGYLQSHSMDIDEEHGVIEGMEIGGASIGVHSTQNSHPSPILSWGEAAEYWSSIQQQARLLGHGARHGVVMLKEKTSDLTRRVLHYYRPPLSPRSRELKDLQYLKRSHKEKVGQWKPTTKNPFGPSHMSSSSSLFHADDYHEDEFCDFLIVLTPQEVYRYWADLLDFREEHLGMESINMLWGERLEDTASTDTIESRTTEEEDEEEMDEDENVGRQKRRKKNTNECSAKIFSVGNNNNNKDSIDTGLGYHHQNEFSTPMTGLLRRRGRTPDTNIANDTSLLYSVGHDRLPNFSERSKSHWPLAEHSLSQSSTFRSPLTASKRSRMSMFEKAINSPLLTATSATNRSRAISYDYSLSMHTNSTGRHSEDGGGETPIGSTTADHRASISTMRRRWGNHTMPLQSGLSTNTMLSPPIRSLTRGEGSVGKLSATLQASLSSSVRVNNCNPNANSSYEHSEEKGDEENQNPNCIRSEYDIPNQVIPRGIAARTNGMLQFLSALKRGIVLRRHRANKEAVFCKIFSHDGGDTIQYQLVDPEEAMVAFKEQRVRYNRNLTHSSSPSTVRVFSRDWSCLDGPGDGSPVHKFKVPDHVAAQRYREKLQREHGVTKRLFEVATKAANSGIIRAAEVVAVHPASHTDPRHPGIRKGELGTASLRRSLSEYFTPHTFSLVMVVGQRFKKGGSAYAVDGGHENKWFSGEGSELQFKTLDFEAATVGEYWLLFRGFLLLHRDAAVGRFSTQRSAGIGGGNRTKANDGSSDSERDEKDNVLENRLQRDTFVEPKTVGNFEKMWVRLRKLDDSYTRGVVMPGAVPPPSDYFLGFKSPGTQIWSRLRLAGLETQRIYAVDTTRVMIKIRCPADRLTDVAEVLRLKMKTVDGMFAPFHEDTAHVFNPLDDLLDIPPLYRGTMASLLRSKDRQMIIDFIIGSRIRDSGAELGQNSDVGKMIQALVPLHMPRKLDSLCKSWVFFWRRERWTRDDDKSSKGTRNESSSEGGLSPLSSRHHNEDGSKSKSSSPMDDRPIPNFITRLFFESFKQPLDAIEEYFGEQVTFYFAWLQHCAVHLLFLSIFGLIMSICQLSTDNFDHPLRPFYAITVMLWTFIVLVNWRKRSNYLAYKWGSIEHKEQETTRPEFHGEYIIDPITKEWEIKYPKWKRWLKYLISIPISLGFTGLALVLILLVHANRDQQISRYFEQKNNTSGDSYTYTFEKDFEVSWKNVGQEAIVTDSDLNREILLDPTYWFIMVALPAVLGLCIPLLNLILTRISVMLNNFENYRTESEYRTHLIIKVFSFRIVSQLGTVYYYAFISTGSQEAIENGIIRMGTSVMVYTTVAHWWNIFLQVYFFMLVRNTRRRLYQRKLRKELKNIELLEEEHVANHRSDAEAREIRLINKRMLLDQAQDDLWFEIMNPPHDSFPEYITAVIQFAFVACFSIVLPITPLLVLFNYLISMRFDAYKLCRGRRRPLAKRTGGIGVWEHLLHIVAVIGVLTNCWLVASTNSAFAWLADEVGTTAKFVIIVAWEHSMLLIKYMMTATISPLPKEVRDEMKRKQHELDQERYADMRLKKERSRRNKLEKTPSMAGSEASKNTAKLPPLPKDSGRPSLPQPTQLAAYGDERTPPPRHFMQAGINNPPQYLSATPDYQGPLRTILSVDEDCDSQPGQLFEC